MKKEKIEMWKTEPHTCNKCCNATVKAGQQYCNNCNSKRSKKNKDNHILNAFGFTIK